ncbi:MAG: hypothetical protein Ct9H300mP13_0820 [Gammaproteobacteria bacterium]|nr:MAG: hypothetical protein Ct9H300mP13_0820 [Gammaproteobacteria bacterium]
MTAAAEEIDDALTEGVTILNGVMPVGLIKGADGRATAVRMSECVVDKQGVPQPVDNTEFEIEADLVVSAIGQGGDLSGIEELGNERSLIDADQFFQVQGRPGHFVAGDIVRPHLLTTAIGQAAVAADSIDHYLKTGSWYVGPKSMSTISAYSINSMSKNSLRQSTIIPRLGEPTRQIM